VNGRLPDLRFTPALLTRPPVHRFCAETTLHHFAIVSFLVDPDALRRHLHPRFEPDLVDVPSGAHALVSAVTFLDRDFRFSGLPWVRGSFGQTNYRAYVTDRETGEHVAWFFGTCLDSMSVVVPRYLWKLPWHRARFAFDCNFDAHRGRYRAFRVMTESSWAPAVLELEDLGVPPQALDGFAQLEAGLVLLTHPLRGFFHRRDGALGTYAIWHDRLRPTAGRVVDARYPLFNALGLAAAEMPPVVHSVLLQRSVDFTIYLPPASLGDKSRTSPVALC
jgi:hypothetical protein